jgi:hypothetical protein
MGMGRAPRTPGSGEKFFEQNVIYVSNEAGALTDHV